MTDTARLRLPLIAAAQAQKHVTHNEALVGLDTLVQLSVIDKDLASPPGSPDEGDCYIVAGSATGAWTGWEGRIARYADGAWRSFLPGAGDGLGWLAFVQDEGLLYVRTGSGWAPVADGLGLGTAAGEDYEEGTWTPALTFVTPGDLSVAHATQSGTYRRIGGIVLVSFHLIATPTYTTASGNLAIAGLPFPVLAGTQNSGRNGAVSTLNGNLAWPAGRTCLYPAAVANTATVWLIADGSAAAAAVLGTAAAPSGVPQGLIGSVAYFAN